MQIRNPSAATLDLVATPNDLSAGGASSALVATVLDAWDAPVAGQTVRLSVSDDDGSQGTIAGGEVFTGTTNAAGQVIAAFSKGPAAVGTVAVRAEVVVGSGAGSRVTHEDVEILVLSDGGPVNSGRIYLPLISR